MIAWLLRLVFFLLALWFALENTAPVPVRLSSAMVWTDVPLIAVIVACFGAGTLAGALALAPMLLRQRRQLAAQARSARETAATDSGERMAEAARRLGAVGGIDADSRLDR